MICARAAPRPEASDTSAPPRRAARPVVAMVWHLWCGGVLLGWLLAMAPKMKRPAAASVALSDTESVPPAGADAEALPSGPRQAAPAPRKKAREEATDLQAPSMKRLGTEAEGAAAPEAALGVASSAGNSPASQALDGLAESGSVDGDGSARSVKQEPPSPPRGGA